eukprot:gene37396-46139_t
MSATVMSQALTMAAATRNMITAVVSQRDATQPTSLMAQRVRQRCAPGRFHELDASALAQTLFGDTVTAHTLMLGYAWQKGLVPLSFDALDRTIELNGAAVALNRRAFTWGRIAAEQPDLLARLQGKAPQAAANAVGAMTLDELIAARAQDLAAYQDDAYAARYRALVQVARDAEQAMTGAGGMAGEFTRHTAVSAYRLMAYKDEYEVARLYGSDEFKASLAAQFSGTGKMSIWLAPPLLSRIDPATGRPKKRKFGPWVFPLLRMLGGLKGLRGTRLDPFGYTEERRMERALVETFEAQVRAAAANLTRDNLAQAVELARLPQEIRGFGPVKHQAMEQYQRQVAALTAAPPVVDAIVDIKRPRAARTA